MSVSRSSLILLVSLRFSRYPETKLKRLFGQHVWPPLGPLLTRLNLGSALRHPSSAPHQPSISLSTHLRLSSPPTPLGPFSRHSTFAAFHIGFCLISQVKKTLA